MTPVAGTVVAERFRLVRPLGQGGMGSVWLADHMALDIPCAIKFIQAESRDSAEVRQRFEREAKIAAQIRSPHVVQVLDHGVWEGMPYIAMERLEGEDLDDRLQRVGRLGAAETASITAQVARALSRAHAAGLVHRDLKPANIFLAGDDDREIAKVLDFGIAKDSTPRISTISNTKTGSILGTPAYMSPEQAQGVKQVDHRSDLWSLAVVVFECVTGQLPFQSEAFGDLLLKIMVQPLPVPSALAPVPPGFDAWWARAAARDPDHRFQSAKELSDALIVALGVSSSDSGAIRLSISDTYSAPGHSLGFDRSSVPGIDRLSGPGLDRSSGSGPPGRPSPILGDEGPSSLAEGITLMAPSEPRPAPIAGSAPLGSARAGELGVAVGRQPRLQTAGPVSTSLTGDAPPQPPSRRRIALAMLAGALVAGVGAMLILRSSGPHDDPPPAHVAAEPPAPPAPVEPPVTPAPLDLAALVPAPSPDPGAPAPHASASSSPRPRATPALTATSRPGATTSPPAPRPTGSARNNPKDFGI